MLKNVSYIQLNLRGTEIIPLQVMHADKNVRGSNVRYT